MKAWTFLYLLTASAPAADWFAAPGGKPAGDGSRDAPWDLATALGQPKSVKPGDTIWLSGGTYQGGFTSTLQGTPETSVTVRAIAGERVTVDCKPRDANDSGLFSVNGAWTSFRGLEFTCSDPKRVTQEKGSWPADIRRGGISSRGSHNKFINLVVHDTAGGFGFWGLDADGKGGEGGEIYGCLIYHNGWKGPDRGHGHAIYAQNASGTKRIVDNVMFNQFGYGLHVYGSDKAVLRGFHVEGNVAFNNGSLSGPGERSHDLFIGGGSPLDRITLLSNYAYGGGVRIGYGGDVANKGVVARDNYISGPARLTSLSGITWTGNTVIAPGTLASFEYPPESSASEYQWDRNTWLRTKVEWAPFNIVRNQKHEGATFAEWQTKTGFDANSNYEEGTPRSSKVVVRPNQYEKGRAHIIVYNWDRKGAVAVNLKDVLQTGQNYRVVNAQNFYGEPLLRGTWDGTPLQLPMHPDKTVQPVGMPDYQLPVPGPEFGVFVVLPVDKE